MNEASTSKSGRLGLSDLLAFSFAMPLTPVFTLLAVNSEKPRDEVQRLAAELSESAPHNP